MSSDAKAWRDERGWWRAVHDGDCRPDLKVPHSQGELELSVVLAEVERCLGRQCDWDIRVYPDGQMGLVGYQW